MNVYKYIDLTYLNQNTNGDNDFIKLLIGMFKNELPEMINNLTIEFENRNWTALGKAAHKIKSNVTILGMQKIADDIKVLEINAKQGIETNNYQSIIENFISATKEVLIELDDILLKMK